jgi:hypothetical protein
MGQQAQSVARAFDPQEMQRESGEQLAPIIAGDAALVEEPQQGADTSSEATATRLADAYAASHKWTELVELVERVGAELNDSSARVALRRRAADACSSHLGDAARARQIWWHVLEDGDDREALEKLLDDAIDRDDRAEATLLIERLSGAGPEDTLPGRAEAPRQPSGTTLSVDDEVIDATDLVELVDT